MKKFEILYNPYTNHIRFRQAFADESWTEIKTDSQLYKFQGPGCNFKKYVEEVEEILNLINHYYNTSGELTIEFIGTNEDFCALRQAVERSNDPKSKGIMCEITEQYPSPSDALKQICEIKVELDDYIDNDELEDNERAEIGRAITEFQDTFDSEIPECVKCANGQKLLAEASELANAILKDAKDTLEKELKKDKQARIKEQEGVRENLKEEINKKPLPNKKENRNEIRQKAREESFEALDEYCDGIEEFVQRTARKMHEDGKDDYAQFSKDIAADCQKNLYDANIVKIKRSIKNFYIKKAKDYVREVKKCVTERRSKLSSDAQNELDKIFDKNIKGPGLQDVTVEKFELLKVSWKWKMKGEQWPDKYASELRKVLKDSFDRQCIVEPVQKYNDQIGRWCKEYTQSIVSVLDEDNAILSELDEKIKMMTNKIEGMAGRLQRLSDIEHRLRHILADDSKKQEV